MLSGHLQCAIPVILSAGVPVSGLEDKIGTAWVGEQYLLGTHKNPEWLVDLVPAQPDCPGERAIK